MTFTDILRQNKLTPFLKKIQLIAEQFTVSKGLIGQLGLNMAEQFMSIHNFP